LAALKHVAVSGSQSKAVFDNGCAVTSGRPICAGRFNMEKRRDISEERTDL